MIELKNVCFCYRDGTEALKNISVTFPENHIFAVLGESGSGKTTLLNCVGRFLIPQAGDIRLNGKTIYEMSEKQFRNSVGVVFQKLFLFPHLTIFENLTLSPIKTNLLSSKEAHERAHQMLDRLGIQELAESYPAQVSGGQAQRAAIARGLMLRPQYILLDEPTSSLDAGTTEDFAHWLQELHEDTNFIIVTHDVPFARQVASSGIYMRNGRKVHSGTIESILSALKSEKENLITGAT